MTKTTSKKEADPKLGKFRTPRDGAFYKGKRLYEGDPITVAAEDDWRPWMIPMDAPVVAPKSFVPPECLPENQKVN